MASRRRPLDLRRLRELVRPEQVLRIMGWSPTARAGGQLRGPCPIHVSRSARSRSLAVSASVVYCHVCHWTGDAVALWAATHYLPTLDAAYEVCQLLGVPPPYFG